MTTQPKSQRGRGRERASAFAVAVLIGAVAAAIPDVAAAGSNKLPFKQSGEGTGRMYSGSRARTSKSGPAPGRILQPPPIPDPEDPRPLHSTAKIPSPEPHLRGGSGYVRKGQYFYEEPTPVQLTRQNPNQRLKWSIPNPENHVRRKTAAAR
ncbi:MAG TPA: hypothetical protein VFD92_21830 [Candidatus Binatia bacterium]|nr:hypothetical protein [Candidatus Binatia bacterium]